VSVAMQLLTNVLQRFYGSFANALSSDHTFHRYLSSDKCLNLTNYGSRKLHGLTFLLTRTTNPNSCYNRAESDRQCLCKSICFNGQQSGANCMADGYCHSLLHASNRGDSHNIVTHDANCVRRHIFEEPWCIIEQFGLFPYPVYKMNGTFQMVNPSKASILQVFHTRSLGEVSPDFVVQLLKRSIPERWTTPCRILAPAGGIADICRY
jgi:hypothetical protein